MGLALIYFIVKKKGDKGDRAERAAEKLIREAKLAEILMYEGWTKAEWKAYYKKIGKGGEKELFTTANNRDRNILNLRSGIGRKPKHSFNGNISANNGTNKRLDMRREMKIINLVNPV